MHLDGSVIINAPRQAVWDFLNDPEAVSECAPGLKSMEVLVPGEKFHAMVNIGFGSMKVMFDTEVEWGERDPLNRATISAHATSPGSAVDVSSEMILKDGPKPEVGETAPEVTGFRKFWLGLLNFFRKLFGGGQDDPAADSPPTPTESTELTWSAEIIVSGRIKGTASRLMGSVSNQLSKAFFTCVRKKIEQ